MYSSLICGLFVAAAVFAAPENHTIKPTLPGTCPEFKGMASLDVTKVEGNWTAVSGVKKGFEKEAARCVKKSIKANPDGSLLITITATKSDNTQKTKTITTTPVQGKPAHFTLSKENDDGAITKTATVIDTDYTDHLVTAICGTDGQKHGYMITVYAHGKTLTAEKLTLIKDHLKKIDNIQDELQPIEQNC